MTASRSPVRAATINGVSPSSEAALASARTENGPKNGNRPQAGRNETDLADLGVRVAPLSKELRQRYDIKDDVKGVVITDVDPEGPAAKRDLRAGDVIIEVAQSEVRNPDDVSEMLKALKDAKRKVALLQIQRSGEPRFVPVPLS